MNHWLKVVIFIGLSAFAVNNLTRDKATRNLLSSSQGNSQTELIPFDQRVPSEQIRYAAFGTSIAWGAYLQNRQKDAFIWQLSPNAANFAIRASGSEYPARCLSSMIGDQVFDVIVLEYTMRTEHSTFELAQRLRQRFPDAVIISFRNWTPAIVLRSETLKKDARNFAVDMGFGSDYIHDPKFHEVAKESANDWAFAWAQTEQIDRHMRDQLGVVLTSKTHDEDDPYAWLSQSWRFADDSFHLSDLGHRDAATRIRDIVDQLGVPSNPRVNDFDMEDNCQNWLLTGVICDDVTYSPNGYLDRISGKQNKFALSFRGGSGSLTVTNHFNKPKDLYISYMTTGPAPSKYPKTSVTIGKRQFFLDPTNPKSRWRNMAVHLPEDQFLGTIEPGEVTLNFQALEETEYPFRLVSFMITTYVD